MRAIWRARISTSKSAAGKRLGPAVVAVTVSALAAMLLAAGVRAADWPQFRGPERDGRSTETGLARDFPQAGPKELWRVSLGEGYSSISRVGDRLFTLFSDGGSEFAVSLDADTGRELWRHRLDTAYSDGQGNGPRSTPTVADGVVYALGAKGGLAALDASSGEPIWELDLESAVGARLPRWGVSTSPLIEGDHLILDGGGRDGASVVALDRRTGETVWSSQDDKAGYSSPVAITVAGIRQVVAFTGRQIVGLAPSDGSALWKMPWKTDWDVNAATPLFVPPNKLFVASGYDTGAAMLELGRSGDSVNVRTVWKSRAMKNQFSSSVLEAGHLYGFDNSILKCLRAVDGEECWKARGFGHGSLIYADGMLIVLGDRGRLSLAQASADGFSELATAQVLDGKCWTPPTLSGGILYLRNEKELVALDLNN